MFDKLIQEIQNAVRPELVTIDGEKFLSKPVHLPPEERVSPLQISTLTGLLDFIKLQPIWFAENAVFVHVMSPTEVQLVGDIVGRQKERDRWAIASCSNIIGSGFKFGTWLLPEEFVIAVQTNFVETDNRAKLLQLVGSLSDDTSKSLRDDGISQTATVRSGVSMVGEVKIKNPVSLAPYRTFREIEQPEGDFVLRLQKGRNDKPELALWQADGGAWKLQAMNSIKTYLEGHLEGEANYSIPVLA